MNNFFQSLNDDIGNMEENLFCPGDSWQVSKSKNNGKLLLPFEADLEQNEVKEFLKERVEDIQARCQDMFDSDDETFQKDFFGGLSRSFLMNAPCPIETGKV